MNTSTLLSRLADAKNRWHDTKNNAYANGYGHLARKFSPQLPATAADYDRSTEALTLALRAAVGSGEAE